MSAAPRWLWLVLLWLVWGLGWPTMRIVFLEVPIWQFRGLGCLLGALSLLAIARLGGHSLAVPRRLWGRLFVAAFFNMVVWHITVGYGLAMIGAGHAALIAYTMPIWVAAIGALFLGERLTWRRVAALALGTAGIAALMSNDFARLGTQPLGVAFLLAAALGWAIGTIYTKRIDWGLSLATFAGWQLLIAAIPICLVAAFTEDFGLHRASAAAVWSGLFVIFATIVGGYLLWFKVVAVFSTTVASIGSLVTPLVGVIGGALLVGEAVGWREIAAMALVLSAVALVVLAPRGTA